MEKRYAVRTKHIYIFIICVFVLLGLRISYLQMFRKNFLRGLAQKQYYRLLHLEGRRGKVFDCCGRVLITGVNSYSIFADPLLIQDVSPTAEVLAANLGLPSREIKNKFSKKDKRFVWIKRKISWKEKETIKSLNLKGVGFTREEKRFYPQEKLAASVLGLVDVDNNGISGLELTYDHYLKGKEGWAKVLQDSVAREVILSPQIVIPQQGIDITSTIDVQVQYWTQDYLCQAVEEFGAVRASAVVMDAADGRILALADYPGYNPNDVGSVPADSMRNCAITDMFEPGSVFKVVTLLAAAEENRFRDQDKFFCEEGKFKIPGSILHDWHPYGELDFREVFIKSSNIGVAKIAAALGPDVLYRCIKKLEFGEKTGIDLPGEIKGSIKPVAQWSRTSRFIIPIGQGIGVNLLQLARTFATIVNGGYLVQPHVVQSVHAPFFSKEVLVEREKVFSPDVARRARDILVGVVEEGTGKLAQVEGAVVGGKTGTAQKYDVNRGGYSSDKYRATFVGFISSLNPPVVIGITVDEPRKSHFGGVVAAPVFSKIAQKLVKYLNRREVSDPLPTAHPEELSEEVYH